MRVVEFFHRRKRSRHRLWGIPHMLWHMVSKRSPTGKRAPCAQAPEASGEFATNLRGSAALRRKFAKTLPEQKTKAYVLDDTRE